MTITTNLKKDLIQEEALKALKANNYNGSIIATMGTGKTVVGIKAIKEGKFKNILITSPRTNLKESWRKELEKWGLEYQGDDVWCDFKSEPTTIYNIMMENIQTCYKWTKEGIGNLDFIICDEIHLIATPEYSNLVVLAKELGIPVLGLTGTPALDDKFKLTFYEQYCPIIFNYQKSAEHGLINKRKTYVYFYDLTDDYRVHVQTKKSDYWQGEKIRYNYLQGRFEECADIIKVHYFNSVVQRTTTFIKSGTLNQKDNQFLFDIVSKDLDYFYEQTALRYEARDMSKDLYYALKLIKGYNYSILGTKAFNMASNPLFPEELKSTLAIYNWAMKERKQLLWNLNSSASIATILKNKILNNSSNKVLLFTENTDQAEKLSKYAVHSKKSETDNSQLMFAFDSGTIRELASCNMLTLGLNLVGANVAIMESFSGSSTSISQKAGRTNRLAVNEIAHVIFIVPRNTQAEVWFNKLNTFQDYEVIDSISDFEL